MARRRKRPKRRGKKPSDLRIHWHSSHQVSGEFPAEAYTIHLHPEEPKSDLIQWDEGIIESYMKSLTDRSF